MSQAGLWDFTVGIPVVIGIYIGGRRLTTVGVFPKPGRCIKHNRHGVFPVGINQSCGNPSFQLSDILFFFIILVLSLFSLFSPTSVYCLSSSSLFPFFFHFVLTPRVNPKKEKYVSDRNGHIHVQCIWFSSFIPSITFFSF